jgi:hypothetical protein
MHKSMSAKGQKRTFATAIGHVRFAPESEREKARNAEGAFSCAGKDHQFFGQVSQDTVGDTL